MGSREIKLLIEKYWQCETTVEEEKIIRDFFNQTVIPPDLQHLRSYFVWQNLQATLSMDSGKRRHSVTKTIRKYFYPALQIAASILILLVCSIGIYTQISDNKQCEQNYTDTFTDPEDAMREARETLGKVSLSILQSQEFVLGTGVNTDSISE